MLFSDYVVVGSLLAEAETKIDFSKVNEDEPFGQVEEDDLPSGVVKYMADKNEEDVDAEDENDDQDTYLDGISEDDDLMSDEVPSADVKEAEPKEAEGVVDEVVEDDAVEDDVAEDDSTEPTDGVPEDGEEADLTDTEEQGDEPKTEDDVVEDEGIKSYFNGDKKGETISEENVILKYGYEMNEMGEVIKKFQKKDDLDYPIEDALGKTIKTLVNETYVKTFDYIADNIKPNPEATLEDFNEEVRKIEVYIGNEVEDNKDLEPLRKMDKGEVIDDVKKSIISTLSIKQSEDYNWEYVKSMGSIPMLVGSILWGEGVDINKVKPLFLQKIEETFKNLFLN